MKNVIVLILFSLLGSAVIAQLSKKGIPPSMRSGAVENQARSATTIATIDLGSMDNSVEADRALTASNAECADCNLMYVGVGRGVNIDLLTSGTRSVLTDGSILFTLGLRSGNAKGMQIIFSQFDLPESGELYIYNSGASEVIGAFTSENNTANGRFTTQMVHGEEVTLEYVVSAADEGNTVLMVETLVHDFVDVFSRGRRRSSSVESELNDNANDFDCSPNILTSPHRELTDQLRDAVGLVMSHNNRTNYTAICSGALINNADHKPYFLSSSHCFSGEPYLDFIDMVIVWNYEKGNNLGSPSGTFIDHTTYGGQVISRGATFRPYHLDMVQANQELPLNDFILIDLLEDPMLKYDVYCMGWDLNKEHWTGDYLGIHHPIGDYKKANLYQESNQEIGHEFATKPDYSIDPENGLPIFTYVEDQTQSTGNVISFNSKEEHVDHGSSGSPLIDLSTNRIVGVLQGGTKHRSCLAIDPQPIYYYQIGYDADAKWKWEDVPETSTYFNSHDPFTDRKFDWPSLKTALGTMSMDGYDPPVPCPIGTDQNRSECFVANFGAGQTVVSVDEKLVFSDESEGGVGDLTYSWDFGLGAQPGTSSQELVEVSYNTPGAKTVELTVCDASGCHTEVKTAFVFVEENYETCGDEEMNGEELGIDCGTDECGLCTDAYHGPITISSSSFDVTLQNAQNALGSESQCMPSSLCSEYDQIKRSTCMIGTVNANGVFYIEGTGVLINNELNGERRPFILTAWHVARKLTKPYRSSIDNLVVIFNAESITCNTESNLHQIDALQGGDLVSVGSFGMFTHLDYSDKTLYDYALIELRDRPEDHFDKIYYAGWQLQHEEGDEVVNFSHPRGSLRKYAEGEITGMEALAPTRAYTLLEETNNNLVDKVYIATEWSNGITSKLSSGSPLFNATTKKLIGLLWGGNSSCSLNGPDYFLSLNHAWNHPWNSDQEEFHEYFDVWDERGDNRSFDFPPLIDIVAPGRSSMNGHDPDPTDNTGEVSFNLWSNYYTGEVGDNFYFELYSPDQDNLENVSVIWDFGQGSNHSAIAGWTQNNQYHTYGKKDITIQISYDFDGQFYERDLSFKEFITIEYSEGSLNGQIDASSVSPVVGEDITFDLILTKEGQSLDLTDPSITSIEWAFGSTASPAFGVGTDQQSTAYGSATDGIEWERVTATVTYIEDGQMFSNVFEEEFRVNDDITFHDYSEPEVKISGCGNYLVSQPITLMPTSINSAITDAQWDFGDGNTLVGSLGFTSYGNKGVYDVTLTVTDPNTSKVTTVNVPKCIAVHDRMEMPRMADFTINGSRLIYSQFFYQDSEQLSWESLDGVPIRVGLNQPVNFSSIHRVSTVEDRQNQPNPNAFPWPDFPQFRQIIRDDAYQFWHFDYHGGVNISPLTLPEDSEGRLGHGPHSHIYTEPGIYDLTRVVDGYFTQDTRQPINYPDNTITQKDQVYYYDAIEVVTGMGSGSCTAEMGEISISSTCWDDDPVINVEILDNPCNCVVHVHDWSKEAGPSGLENVLLDNEVQNLHSVRPSFPFRNFYYVSLDHWDGEAFTRLDARIVEFTFQGSNGLSIPHNLKSCPGEVFILGDDLNVDVQNNWTVSPSSGTEYLSNTTEPLVVFTPEVAGQFVVTLESTDPETGCVFTDKSYASIGDVTASGRNAEICVNSSQDLSLQVYGGSSEYSIEWVPTDMDSESNFGQPSDAGITFQPTESGEYSYTVNITDSDGCQGSTVFTATSSEPFPTILDDLTQPCGGAGELDAGEGAYSYLWSTGETTSSIIAQFPGDYTVHIKNGEGCDIDEVVTFNTNYLAKGENPGEALYHRKAGDFGFHPARLDGIVGNDFVKVAMRDEGKIYVEEFDKFGEVTSREVLFTPASLGGGFDGYQYFGRHLQTVGDLDKNGVSDLAFHAANEVPCYEGKPRQDVVQEFDEVVFVLLLNADGSLKDWRKIGKHSNGMAGALNGDVNCGYDAPLNNNMAFEDRFGESIINIGDVDGDGNDDLAIGAPGYGSLPPDHSRYHDFDVSLWYDMGAVFILLMDDNHNVKSSHGVSAEDFEFDFGDDSKDRYQALQPELGMSLVSVGDLDGDGRNELLAVSRSNDNKLKLNILFLTSDGKVDKQKTTITPMYGAHGGIESLGDVNHDGKDEILVYSNGWNIYNFDANGSPHLLHTITQYEHSASGDLENIYIHDRQVESIGDVNRDGVEDIIFKGPYSSEYKMQIVFMDGIPDASTSEYILPEEEVLCGNFYCGVDYRYRPVRAKKITIGGENCVQNSVPDYEVGAPLSVQEEDLNTRVWQSYVQLHLQNGEMWPSGISECTNEQVHVILQASEEIVMLPGFVATSDPIYDPQNHIGTSALPPVTFQRAHFVASLFDPIQLEDCYTNLRYSEELSLEEDPNEELSTSALQVFPNPVIGTATIELSGEIIEGSTLSVYNSLGNRVHQMEVDAEGSMQFNLADYPNGVYVVSLNTGNEIKTTSLILLK